MAVQRFGSVIVSPSVSISRCRVVPSVTLGGTSSPVLYLDSGETYSVCDGGSEEFCAGGIARSVIVGEYAGVPFSSFLSCMYCAIPAPRLVNAGISMQNHQPRPIVENARTIETTRNASPVNIFVMARSQLSGLPLRSSSSIGCGGTPESACETFPRSVPQLRQNLPVSGFCIPHFGQNIAF